MPYASSRSSTPVWTGVAWAVCPGLLVALLLLGCASVSDRGSAAMTPEQISRIVDNPGRSATDRSNDQRRLPKQMLAFIDPRPGMVALDLSAAGGYTTELLARAVGPTGLVYGQSAPRDPNRASPQPVSPEGNSHPALQPSPSASTPVAAMVRRTSPEALAERNRALQASGTSAPIMAVVQRFEDPVPAERALKGLDLVTVMFNYHDLGHMGVDRAQMNRALFAAIKPGGTYVIADHAGRPGTGISESGSLHRIEENFLVQEVEAAGFKLSDHADFLRNPKDPRDQNTPVPPQAKDEFVLKFVRP